MSDSGCIESVLAFSPSGLLTFRIKQGTVTTHAVHINLPKNQQTVPVKAGVRELDVAGRDWNGNLATVHLLLHSTTIRAEEETCHTHKVGDRWEGN